MCLAAVFYIKVEKIRKEHIRTLCFSCEKHMKNMIKLRLTNAKDYYIVNV